MEFIKEGHYVIGEESYMSIWTYKRENGILPNDRESNYQDAINISCSDRHWKPFNESIHFKAGWHYNEACLNKFYNL